MNFNPLPVFPSRENNFYTTAYWGENLFKNKVSANIYNVLSLCMCWTVGMALMIIMIIIMTITIIIIIMIIRAVSKNRDLKKIEITVVYLHIFQFII